LGPSAKQPGNSIYTIQTIIRRLIELTYVRQIRKAQKYAAQRLHAWRTLGARLRVLVFKNSGFARLSVLRTLKRPACEQLLFLQNPNPATPTNPAIFDRVQP
jgi:hypothetical protein